ncbi:response regulator transcription factor [Panacibacter sp. DH6]|uniref:Response regulator transcription factor n=1 Tax=Panacibacter microcysteis TaxID=2793269 RepID=A0A931GYD9_9BACT|nr:response regulator transcription factor [Panacibacter microcysteis]MBG9375492.1 response regulator transcription factor [Panacibacter microcysteis]
MVRIAVVDDKASNRSVLKDKLRRNPLFNIVLEATDGEDFLQQIKSFREEQLPHIVLMDLEMPHVDGVTAIGTASSLYPSVKFVVLTIFDDDDKIFRAIKAGACGYLLKEESGQVITGMLMNLWESGAGPISPSIAYKILQMVQHPLQIKEDKTNTPDIFLLSEREKEILQLLSEGLEYKEIAARIFISPNTVKKHSINIYNKLHVNSKAQALRIAYTKGLI